MGVKWRVSAASLFCYGDRLRECEDMVAVVVPACAVREHNWIPGVRIETEMWPFPLPQSDGRPVCQLHGVVERIPRRKRPAHAICAPGMTTRSSSAVLLHLQSVDAISCTLTLPWGGQQHETWAEQRTSE